MDSRGFISIVLLGVCAWSITGCAERSRGPRGDATLDSATSDVGPDSTPSDGGDADAPLPDSGPIDAAADAPIVPGYTVESISASCFVPGDTGVSSGDRLIQGDPDFPGMSSTFRTLPSGGVFPFFGEAMERYAVSEDGVVFFSPTFVGTSAPSFGGVGSALPCCTSVPYGFFAAFWDNLYGNGLSRVYELGPGHVGSAPGLAVALRWSRWAFKGTASPTDIADGTFVTFEAHIYENGVLEVHGCNALGTTDRSGGSMATIGIQRAFGADAAVATFHRPDALVVGAGYRFTPD